MKPWLLLQCRDAALVFCVVLAGVSGTQAFSQTPVGKNSNLESIIEEPLQSSSLFAAGLIDAREAGFPTAPWQGFEEQTFTKALALLDPGGQADDDNGALVKRAAQVPVALKKLWRLALVVRDPAMGKRLEGQKDAQLAALRLRALATAGRAEDVLSLAAISGKEGDPAWVGPIVEAEFMLGRGDTACSRSESIVRGGAKLARWRIVCLLRDDQAAAASLTFGAMPKDAFASESERVLLQAVLGDDFSPDLPEADTMLGLLAKLHARLVVKRAALANFTLPMLRLLWVYEDVEEALRLYSGYALFSAGLVEQADFLGRFVLSPAAITAMDEPSAEASDLVLLRYYYHLQEQGVLPSEKLLAFLQRENATARLLALSKIFAPTLLRISTQVMARGTASEDALFDDAALPFLNALHVFFAPPWLRETFRDWIAQRDTPDFRESPAAERAMVASADLKTATLALLNLGERARRGDYGMCLIEALAALVRHDEALWEILHPGVSGCMQAWPKVRFAYDAEVALRRDLPFLSAKYEASLSGVGERLGEKTYEALVPRKKLRNAPAQATDVARQEETPDEGGNVAVAQEAIAEVPAQAADVAPQEETPDEGGNVAVAQEDVAEVPAQAVDVARQEETPDEGGNVAVAQEDVAEVPAQAVDVAPQEETPDEGGNVAVAQEAIAELPAQAADIARQEETPGEGGNVAVAQEAIAELPAQADAVDMWGKSGVPTVADGIPDAIETVQEETPPVPSENKAAVEETTEQRQ